MRKFIVPILLLICIFASKSNAQKTVNPVIYTSGVPASCVYGRVYVNVATGFAYTYKTGVGCILVAAGSTTFTGGAVTTPITGADGSAAAPTFSFTNATGTGTYLAGANILGFTTAGTLRWSFNASGNLIPNGDGTYTIGAVGATRPNIYAYAISSGSFSNAAGEIRWGTTTGGVRILSANLQLGSGVHFCHSGGDPTGVACDVGLVRTSAGKYRLSNGSTGYGTVSAAAATTYRTTTQSINDATWTSIGFDAELDDTNTFHDNVTNNSRITINSTTAGKVTFICSVDIASGTGARAIRLYKNNTTVIYGPKNFTAITGGDPTTLSFVVDIPDTANADFYECQVFQGSGGALNTGSGRASVVFSAKSY